MQRFHSQRSGRYTAGVVGVTLLTVVAVCSAPGETGSKGVGKRKGAKRKEAAPTAGASPNESGQSLTDIPLPIGHEAKGLTLPDFDVEGHLRGKFTAGSARRIDQD